MRAGRPASRLMWAAVLVAAAPGAGCGSSSRPREPHHAAPQRPRAAQLVYVWRNFEETGIPEEMTIYSDGEVRYRNLLHTQSTLRVLADRLTAARLTRIRRTLVAVDLSRFDASAVKPRRSGYRYVIRSRGRVATAADGHLHGRLRPLVLELRAEMDRLQQRSL